MLLWYKITIVAGYSGRIVGRHIIFHCAAEGAVNIFAGLAGFVDSTPDFA